MSGSETPSSPAESAVVRVLPRSHEIGAVLEYLDIVSVLAHEAAYGDCHAPRCRCTPLLGAAPSPKASLNPS